ncbi:MAG: M3 family metallopeptidase [Chitinophagales bacterium]|nr:M3 family metallopeptidase [Chitinophagales bacterium]
MKRIFFFAPIVLLTLSCHNSKETVGKNINEMKMIDDKNPLLVESVLPYFAPDFTKFKNEHFEPAIQEGVLQKEAAIHAIATQSSEPTFENTIVALEKSDATLNRVMMIFGALESSNTNDTLQAIDEKIAPILAGLSDKMYLNVDLFKRIKKLYDNRFKLNLDKESLKLLEVYYQDFEIAGANLSDENKEILKRYNSRLATLSSKFSKILLSANNASEVKFTNVEDLNGLSEETLEALYNKDSNVWIIPLQNTTQQPLLSSMKNRESRERLFNASWNRTNEGEFDTKGLIKEMVELRAKKAHLLGFDNFAAWSLQNSMAKNPENVNRFFANLIPATISKAQMESDEIQKMIDSKGEKFSLEPWDWDYYSEMVRKQKYDLDEEQIKPYFDMYTVLEKGVFFAATKLYGITFHERSDIPVYHADVRVYEILEENGDPLGLFYADFFARPTKRGGAWMSNFVNQSKLFNRKPVIYNVCNYPKPSPGQPALLTYDEVETMFHEFGHALHGFFANQQYPSLSGTAVARDFVEFPSQINENWALYPEVLKNYAIHYKTKEQIPQSLIDKIKKSTTFNQGYSLGEVLAAACLDMQWHTVAADTVIEDVDAFEIQILHNSLMDKVHAMPPRYRSTYFAHIFGGGYSAGYYAYLWTEMLDHDAFDFIEKNGGLTRANGQKLRDMILSKGNTEDLKKMYLDWRGVEPQIEPMLKARGLN